jgi:hypothetical protein
METNKFYDESFEPDDENLIQIFGDTGKYWQAIKNI